MNIFQRIILIIGAIAFLFVVWVSQEMNLQLMVIRVISIIGATLIIFYALKGIKRRPKQSDTNPESTIQIKKETLDKLNQTMIELKMQLLESLERERIRDKYLDKM